MSGSKRRTGYRKTLQDDVLFGLPEPSLGQCLGLVQRASGANLFEVYTETGERGVGMLPTRFRNLVWLKRGDFVILSAPSMGVMQTSSGGVGAVTHMIESILYDNALKHLRAIGRLPASLESEREILINSGGVAGNHEDSGGREEEEEEEDNEEESGDILEVSFRRMQGPRDLPPEEVEEEEQEFAEEEQEVAP